MTKLEIRINDEIRMTKEGCADESDDGGVGHWGRGESGGGGGVGFVSSKKLSGFGVKNGVFGSTETFLRGGVALVGFVLLPSDGARQRWSEEGEEDKKDARWGRKLTAALGLWILGFAKAV